MRDDDKRYNVFWVDPDRGFQGVLANLTVGQLADAFRDATRWAYGSAAAEVITRTGYKRAVKHVLDELGEGGNGEYGRITLALAEDDYEQTFAWEGA